MQPPEGRAIYDFGEFRLDAGQRLLTSRTDGRVLPLVSRAFDTLLYLVERPGELVSKDALLKAVWPGTIVEENNLNQSIAAIRRAIGERAGEHKYIVTIPGRGFKFVAPVSSATSLPGAAPAVLSTTVPIAAVRAPPGWKNYALAAIAAIAIFVAVFVVRHPNDAPPAPATLAILPFKSISPTDEDASLRFGMTDTLISRLRELDGITVQPFSSVRRYGNAEQDALEAARNLGVASVLDGTIQRSGDRLRVTTRLLNVADGRQLWSQQFDENFTDIFTVQDTIAARVTDALAIRLTGQTDRRLTRRFTEDADAYQLYLSGWFQRSRAGEDGFRRSIDFFEKAIARDPNYPLPYVGLADGYAMLGVFGALAPQEAFPRALVAANKALELDNELGEAHTSLAHIKAVYERDLPGAEREYQLALSLAPDYAMAHMWYGLTLAWSGRYEDGLAQLRQAQELEPLQLGASANIGMLMYFSRRYDESIQQLRKVLAVEPGLDHARSFLGRAYLRKGDPAAAIAEFKLRKSLSVGSYADLGMALALAGRRDEAAAELDRLIALRQERYVSAYDIAAVQASLGETDQAFEWLNRAFEERAQMRGLLGVDPSFDSLREDSRMKPLLERLRPPRAEKT
ncbi:MAG TPA: winged helix-turn-helix domain-containing protein [Steroidobacteraceae bacterium]|nr:winged helix-turn-helix domain-containing protein [Steroidobacteraceae bacterium]